MNKKIKLNIIDMHCTSCAITIDGNLEDTDGIVEAKTNYAKQQVEVVYDQKKLSVNEIIDVIKKTGYTASPFS